MVGTVELRVFETQNLSEAGAVYAACFNEPPWQDGWTNESAVQRLEALLQFPTALSQIAFLEGSLVGLAIGHVEPWVDGPHFYLSELCVSPAHRNRRVGSALMEGLLGRLSMCGVVSVYLLTERASAAEGFFRAHDFARDSDSIKLWRQL